MDSKTLILGDSRDARQIAEALLERDGDVIVVIPGNTDNAVLFDDLKAGAKAHKLELLPVAGSFTCKGSVGRFSLTFNENGTSVTRTVSSIVIADNVSRKPNFSLYGLTASKRVIPLSRFHEMIRSGGSQVKLMLSGKKVVFISGLAEESNPVVSKDVMRCALDVQQKYESQVYISPEISRLPETVWKPCSGRPKKLAPST